jgi:hypothetical protein
MTRDTYEWDEHCPECGHYGIHSDEKCEKYKAANNFVITGEMDGELIMRRKNIAERILDCLSGDDEAIRGNQEIINALKERGEEYGD